MARPAAAVGMAGKADTEQILHMPLGPIRSHVVRSMGGQHRIAARHAPAHHAIAALLFQANADGKMLAFVFAPAGHPAPAALLGQLRRPSPVGSPDFQQFRRRQGTRLQLAASHRGLSQKRAQAGAASGGDSGCLRRLACRRTQSGTLPDAGILRKRAASGWLEEGRD